MALGTDLARDLAYPLAYDTAGAFVDILNSARPGGSVFTADYYAIDDDTDKVSDFIDWLDPTHTLHQGTSAQQCATPTPSSLFNNRLAATFVDQRYISTRAASAWRYLHDGTGVTVYAVLSWDSVVGTQHVMNTSPLGPSVGAAVLASSGTLLLTGVSNAAGNIAVAASAGAALSVSTPYYVRFRYAEGVLPKECDADLKTVQQGAVDTSGAPSVGVDPANTLRLGNRSSGSPFVGKWLAAILIPGAFDSAKDALIKRYFTAAYGVT